MINSKPKDPYPKLIKQVLKRFLPGKMYKKYLSRHEEYSMRIWREIAKSLEPTKAILDIGAFVGSYSLAARENNLAAKVIAFEPNPISASVLRRNCENKDILIEELAVSDKEGTISFNLQNAMSGIVTDHVCENANVVSVQSTSVDAYVRKHKLSPGLIKIDTEEEKGKILKEANTCLSEHRPVILCEVLSDEAGSEVMKALPDGYLYFHIDENKGVRLDQTITRKEWRNRNYLLVPVFKKQVIDKLIVHKGTD